MIIISPEGNGQVFKDAQKFCEVRMFEDPAIAGPGWALIAVVYQDNVTLRNADIVVYDPPYTQNGCQYGGGYTNHTVCNTPLVERTARFLMGRTKDEVLEEKLTLCEKLKKYAKASNDEKAKAVAALDKAEGETMKTFTALRESRQETAKLDQKLGEYEIVQAEMMKDISKVRNEIGEAKWKEIVGMEKES